MQTNSQSSISSDDKKQNFGFIKALWGILDDPKQAESKYYKRRTKIQNDITTDILCRYKTSCTIVVFGNDNFKMLTDLGYSCLLADKEPIKWSMTTQQFRHKLEAFKIGMSLYEQIVFLDWDTLPILPRPNNFWQVLQEKAPMQATLRTYRRRKAEWRTKYKTLLPCASFVYINDENIPNELIKIWQNLNCPWSEEIVMAKWFDNYLEEYYQEQMNPINYEKHFEPNYFYLNECKPLNTINPNYYDNKPRIFVHRNKTQINKILRNPSKFNFIKEQ